jgi:hypothetical protein
MRQPKGGIRPDGAGNSEAAGIGQFEIEMAEVLGQGLTAVIEKELQRGNNARALNDS